MAPPPHPLTLSLLLLLLLSLSLLHPPASADPTPTGQIGINYGRIADNLPSPDKAVALLRSQSLPRAKLYDTDPSVLSAFRNSGILLTVALPNENLSAAAASQSFTDAWLESRILPFYPSVNLSSIAVGNEANADPDLTPLLVPAITNVFLSLQKHSLHTSVKISSPISLTGLASSYPSSNGSFKSDLINPMIRPMLDFLRKTSSPLMVNAYPFFAYSGNSGQISLDYALFRPNSGVVDSGNGLKYTNLFEAQLDAVHAAMNRLGYDDVRVTVTETGWPSKGDPDEIGADGPNAQAYNGNLVKRVLTGGGTPLRPDDPLDVYLFALFNEDQKPGPTSERNYGLFYPDEGRVYEMPVFTAGESEAEKGGENEGSKVRVTAARGTWCVASEGVGEEKLQEGIDWACGQGGADCRPIQQGATCYSPNSLVAHASYAFNSYYQMQKRGASTCDFGGAAHVVTQAPRYGSCEFPTGY